MKKLSLVLLFSAAVLWGYEDSDMDGVSDSKDLCPNTSIELVVDQRGCPQTLDLTLMIGYEHSEGAYGGTATVTSDTSMYYVGMKRGLYGLSVASSSDKSEDASSSSSSQGDTYVSLAYYGLKSTQTVQNVLQLVVKLATADTTIGTGETDYGLRYSTTVMKPNYSLMGSLGYTVTGDSAIKYKDILSASIGVAKQMNNRLYMSGSLNYADAYVSGADKSMNALIYAAYSLNRSYFLTASYSMGLSDAVADSSYSLSVGATF